ncbi:MAG: DUF2461 domain-containing protein [Pseudomonadota bacterium]
MKTTFDGFPKEMFGFISDLGENNNREWFGNNRNRYKDFVVDPVTRFIESVGEFLPAISDAYTADTRRNGGSMFRIYRDTRFSRDKRPYKENVGCQFCHTDGMNAHAPGFYVHLAPTEVFIGGGIWKPDNNALNKIRNHIAGNPEQWSSVINDAAFSNYFGELQGESLKRPPRGFDTGDPHIEDLKRKSYIAFRHVNPVSALKPAFIKEVEKAFSTAMPLMHFITSALEIRN